MTRFVETFFRHWVAALVPLLLVPLAAVYTLFSSQASAQIAANVWVNNASDKQLSYADPNVPPAQNTQAALTQLLQSQSFDLHVARQSSLYWKTVAKYPAPAHLVQADFQKNVVVGQSGPDLVTIVYTSKDPRVGVQVVQNILKNAPNEILKLNQKQVSNDAPAYKNQLNFAQLQLGQAATSLHRYMQAHNIKASDVTVQSLTDPRFATLYQTMQSAETNVQLAQEQLSSVTAERTVQGAFQVIDAPSATVIPVAKKKVLTNVVIALAIALLLGGVFVVTRTALDHTLRSAYEVPDLIGLPVLAVLPYSAALAGPTRRRLRPSWNRPREI